MVKKGLNFNCTQFTELTDAHWAILRQKIETGRKIHKDLRMVVNCILKITRTGCQWRNIDEKYGPWQSVYYYFRKWTKNGTFDAIIQELVCQERVRQGREAEAWVAAIDSQSVKKVGFISLDTGIDGNKKINGRKRHILVDTLGLPIGIFVGAANMQDGVAGKELLPCAAATTKRLQIIRADNAYRGNFMQDAQWCGYEVEITQKPPTEKGFVPQIGRWQVERSFAWLNFHRRLSKDFEKTVQSSVAFIQIAFIAIILNRLKI